MTLAEFQPYVEQAVTAYEWVSARARWHQGLLNEREALEKALTTLSERAANQRLLEPLMEGVQFSDPVDEDDLEPYRARLQQIADELKGDVTPDRVPQLPLRSIPMDLITAAVIRRCLRLPAEFPVLSIKTLPTPEAIADAVAAIAMKWQTPNGASADQPARITSHV
jgi:hypothetical protein